MITRFDHAVLAVDDLAAAAALLRDTFGLIVQAAGRHPDTGTENLAIRIGAEDTIMVSGVYDRDSAVAAGIKRARLLDLLAQRRGGWLSFGMATDDIDGLATRLTRAGMDVFGPYAMRRECPDGRTLHGRVLQPGAARCGDHGPALSNGNCRTGSFSPRPPATSSL